MKYMNTAMLAGCVLFAAVVAGCGSSAVTVNKEPSMSAIHAAEAVGASEIPSASLYLQLAKEGLENGKTLAENGEKEQSESMLSRSQADAELAVALSHGYTDKMKATKALERVKTLQQENPISNERK